MRLQVRIVLDRNEGPRILHDAWAAGEISDLDLRALIPDTWLFMDWPERVIGAAAWTRMYRAVGFLSVPYGLLAPAEPMTLYRGASPELKAGMSWTEDVDRADQFRQRHSWYAATAIYRTVVAPGAVLAFIERRGESPPEVVVDPAMLIDIDQMTDLYPMRSHGGD